MTTVDAWEMAARIAAWAPDRARELLASTAGENADPDAGADVDDRVLALTSELMGKAFAVTGAWELAKSSYLLAAETWTDAARSAALRELAARLPLAPFTSDRDAIDAERALARRMLDPRSPPPLLLRAITEIRRALAPRRITGAIEAACELAPIETALVMTLACEPDAAPKLLADWYATLAPSLWVAAPIVRPVELGLVSVLPVVAAHPRLVSRLRGRTAIEMPRGLRFEELPATGLRRFRIEPVVGADVAPEALREAELEIRIHGGVIASDGVSSPR